MMFAQQENHLMSHFLECIHAVKRHMTVLASVSTIHYPYAHSIVLHPAPHTVRALLYTHLSQYTYASPLGHQPCFPSIPSSSTPI